MNFFFRLFFLCARKTMNPVSRTLNTLYLRMPNPWHQKRPIFGAQIMILFALLRGLFFFTLFPIVSFCFLLFPFVRPFSPCSPFFPCCSTVFPLFPFHPFLFFFSIFSTFFPLFSFFPTDGNAVRLGEDARGADRGWFCE